MRGRGDPQTFANVCRRPLRARTNVCKRLSAPPRGVTNVGIEVGSGEHNLGSARLRSSVAATVFCGPAHR
eukprot:4801363-Pyramimonas_sp.AAC.1